MPFTPSEIIEINKAIKESEEMTSAEIVPLVIKKINQGKLPFFKGIIKVLNMLSISLLLAISYLSVTKDAKLAYLWVALSCVALLILSAKVTIWVNKEFQKLLIKRAEDEFRALGINQTLYSNGVLILVSLQDRQLVVLADRKILNSGPMNTWSEIILNFQLNIKKHNFQFALITAIKEVGLVCDRICPKNKTDTNEIKNEIIIKG